VNDFWASLPCVLQNLKTSESALIAACDEKKRKAMGVYDRAMKRADADLAAGQQENTFTYERLMEKLEQESQVSASSKTRRDDRICMFLITSPIRLTGAQVDQRHDC
jgi:hypothetical protein